MQYDDVKEKWSGAVNELALSDKIKIGGETAFSYHRFEGNFPNVPLVAMEINDVYPKAWPVFLKDSIGEDALKNPVTWAQKCVNEFDADLIFYDMPGTHQDKENIGPQQAAEGMNAVLSAVELPVIVRPDGNNDKKNEVFSKCCEQAKRQIIIGSAKEDNYRTITASAMAGKHFIITEAPIDVNISKQTNILVTQMNFPLDRIIMDPLTGALGYGLEYTYSVMERIRLQTFNDDKMMSPPLICCVGQDVWKAKEIKIEAQNLGSNLERGINWETTTAISLILSGANIVVVRHPESVKLIKKFIKSLYNS
ncbi:MAG: acetyl-CoA decarbonylase/synthase complex subunit delta [Elusimicrobia bacterium]|nr:acetyl-CoA decarbonylase/synthase complex subunit delta [Candidatus Liberimonas magnetica]